MPNDSPDMGSNPNMPLTMGSKLASFKEAFEKTGYKIEDVKKIVVTHKHPRCARGSFMILFDYETIGNQKRIRRN